MATGHKTIESGRRSSNISFAGKKEINFERVPFFFSLLLFFIFNELNAMKLLNSFIIFTGLLSSTLAQSCYQNKVASDSTNDYSVEYFDTYKVLTNLITNEKYALVCNRNGTSADLTSGFHAVVDTPLTAVGVDTELDVLPFFEVYLIKPGYIMTIESYYCMT